MRHDKLGRERSNFGCPDRCKYLLQRPPLPAAMASRSGPQRAQREELDKYERIRFANIKGDAADSAPRDALKEATDLLRREFGNPLYYRRNIAGVFDIKDATNEGKLAKAIAAAAVAAGAQPYVYTPGHLLEARDAKKSMENLGRVGVKSDVDFVASNLTRSVKRLAAFKDAELTLILDTLWSTTASHLRSVNDCDFDDVKADGVWPTDIDFSSVSITGVYACCGPWPQLRDRLKDRGIADSLYYFDKKLQASVGEANGITSTDDRRQLVADHECQAARHGVRDALTTRT